MWLQYVVIMHKPNRLESRPTSDSCVRSVCVASVSESAKSSCSFWHEGHYNGNRIFIFAVIAHDSLAACTESPIVFFTSLFIFLKFYWVCGVWCVTLLLNARTWRSLKGYRNSSRRLTCSLMLWIMMLLLSCTIFADSHLQISLVLGRKNSI